MNFENDHPAHFKKTSSGNFEKHLLPILKILLKLHEAIPPNFMQFEMVVSNGQN